MFRIDKQLVQVAGPADIPLIPVQLPDPAPASEAETLTEAVAAANMAAASLAGSAAAATEEIETLRGQILREAQQQAEQLLQKAAKDADAKLQAAETQAEGIRADAWQSGCEEGKHEALKIQAEQNRAAQAQLNILLTEIAAAHEALYQRYEDEIVDLALAIADKITNTVVKQDGGAMEAMIVHALKHMRREAKITVRVSEEHYQTFFNAESMNFVLGDESINVAVESDPLLGDGGLILESDLETVNAGTDSQLKYIALAFGRPRESGL